MSSAHKEDLDRFELFGENLESPPQKRTKSPVKRKRDKESPLKKYKKSIKRTKTHTKHYDNNDTEFKQMLENIENPGLPDEYDTFNAEMEQLYKTLERNDNAKELTEIIKELTERINEKIKTEKENIQKSTNQIHIQYRKNNIIRYKNNLIKLNNLDDEQKADILEIYNNRDIHKDDKRNAINAIINGDKVMNARIRDINANTKEIIRMPISMANSVDKSTSPTRKRNEKKKRGGNKSKSKKYIKSKK